MKTLIAIISTLISFNLHAQMDVKSSPVINDSNSIYPNKKPTIDVFYGNFIYQKSASQNFNSFRYSKFGNPLQTVGISLTSVLTTFDHITTQSIHIAYSQIIPQSITINDSISGRINGGFYGMSLASYDCTKNSKHVTILFGAGFNTGRLRISSQDYRGMKNAFFAPSINFTPRFRIKQFMLSLRTEYQFDITNRKWKNVKQSKKPEGLEIENLNQSGLLVNFCLSWCIG